ASQAWIGADRQRRLVIGRPHLIESRPMDLQTIDVQGDGVATQPGSVDAAQVQEWCEALEAVVLYEGSESAQQLLAALDEKARSLGIAHHVQPFSAYRNTIPV